MKIHRAWTSGGFTENRIYREPRCLQTRRAGQGTDHSFGLADVVAEIEPLGCIMAGDSGPPRWMREKDLTPKQKRQIEHRAERRKTRQNIRHWEEDED